MSKTYYDVLELPETASATQIKDSYKKLALKNHPDKNKNKNAVKKMVEINEAYSVLKDPKKKKAYDLSLAQEENNPLVRYNTKTVARSEPSEIEKYYGPKKLEEHFTHDDHLSINKLLLVWMIGSIVILILGVLMIIPGVGEDMHYKKLVDGVQKEFFNWPWAIFLVFAIIGFLSSIASTIMFVFYKKEHKKFVGDLHSKNNI